MNKRRRSFGFRAAVVLVIGVVLYPLSMGPVAVLLELTARERRHELF